jgi:phage terminase large subunit-like protein
LTIEGQRLARLNACRQWLIPIDTLTALGLDPGTVFEWSVRFFDQWYLRPDPEADFDPMFYDDDPLVDAPFHHMILGEWGRNRTNITIAPRGSAKSYLVRKASLVRLVTRPMYSITYATSTADNAKTTGQSIKDQLINNQRLRDDWDPECPGESIVPRRNELTFGATYFQITNRSWFRAISAESKQRGMRPRRYVLDDPEYDPKASTSMQLIRDYMERLLFKVVMPMVTRAGCGADWLATFVSKRHYAWHAMDVTAAGVAKDPRFNFWSRTKVKALYDDPETGEPRSCWPDMWPATIKERLANPRWKDRMSLEEVEQTIGRRNFLAEFMASPGAGDDIFFPALTEEQHGYELLDVDDAFTVAPGRSGASMRWWSTKQSAWVEQTFQEFLKDVRLFMTLDTSYTATSDSDSKVACLMAANYENDLFVMDLWSGKCQEPELVKAALRMADRWKCPVLWPEVVREGHSLYNALTSVINTRAQEELAGVGWAPAIKKINPGRTEKTAKIASLLLRFEHGKIKLPLWRRNDRGWRNLFNQIAEFNPDAPDGGLQHDDEVDCVAMSQYVMRRRVSPAFRPDEESLSAIDRILRGEDTHESGLPLGLYVDMSKVTGEQFSEILRLRTEGSHERTKV